MPPGSSTNIPLLIYSASIWYVLIKAIKSSLQLDSELQDARNQISHVLVRKMQQIWQNGKEFIKALRVNHIANKEN